MSLIGALTKAAKAGEAAKKTAPFYSAVDEALGNLKRPKGTGIEFLTEVLKQPGVKKAEIADRKLEQAFKDKGKMTKEEAQQVLADNPPPQRKEKLYDESTAIDEADIREAVARDMFDRPYEDITNQYEHRRIMDEVYRQMNDDLGTKFGKYKTPDGENYREILLKLPITKPNASNYSDPAKYDADLKAYNAAGKSDYYANHFPDDANIIAHMRVQDRKGPNGEKILHVEEIQSDIHQAGRKSGYKNEEQIKEVKRAFEEYKTNARERLRQMMLKDSEKDMSPESALRFVENYVNKMDDGGVANFLNEKSTFNELYRAARDVGATEVPDAPFKKNWHELAMKRLLNYAADNGYDSIAITPGAEQAKRYDLSKQINTISWNKQTNGMYGIEADTIEGRPIIKKGLTEQELEDTVGKEVASRIVNGVGQFENDPLFGSGFLTSGRLENLDLKVGGEGMKGFYDKMLPDYLNSYGKSYGTKVEMDSIPVSTRDPKDRSWGGGQGDHPFTTSQDLSEPFDGMVELLRRNPETGEHDLVGRMLRADSERRIAQELQKLDTVNQVKLHNFPITPEMRESIKQKGLPLYQQVGIPTAGAASQALQPEEELGLSGGGSVAKLAALAKIKKLKEEMNPKAEAVKALIARDENRYLADVVPNSLTNAEIEAEIKRMAAKTPMIMKPSALTELRKIVQQEKGNYGSRRLERAADEVPNLEKMYTLDALKERFLGDNAKALMTMSPADFEKFASEVQGKTSVGPKAAESAKQGDISKYTVPTNEYVKHLERIAMFDSVPYLNLAKEEVGLPLLPYISGHEGRHRSRALAGRGEKRNMVGITPTMDLREGLPRGSQEEFIEAMKKELKLSGGLVLPQSEPMLGGRPPIILPDVYAKGGAIKPKVKKSVSGKVKMSDNRDAMFMELSNKKLKRK